MNNLSSAQKCNIIEKTAAEFAKYGIEVVMGDTITVYIPKTSDVSDMAGTKLGDKFCDALLSNGYSLYDINDINRIYLDKHWSWLQYIGASSKDKVDEDLKDIKHQDLSIKFNTKKSEEEKVNKTIDISDKSVDVLLDDLFDISDEYKKSIEMIKETADSHPMLKRYVQDHARLTKTMLAYGVLIEDTKFDHINNIMYLKISVPSGSCMTIDKKEACGDYLASKIAKATREALSFCEVKIKYKERNVDWNLQLVSSMIMFAHKSYGEIVDLYDWYDLEW